VTVIRNESVTGRRVRARTVRRLIGSPFVEASRGASRVRGSEETPTASMAGSVDGAVDRVVSGLRLRVCLRAGSSGSFGAIPEGCADVREDLPVDPVRTGRTRVRVRVRISPSTDFSLDEGVRGDGAGGSGGVRDLLFSVTLIAFTSVDPVLRGGERSQDRSVQNAAVRADR
jgi:hypothetical protein